MRRDVLVVGMTLLERVEEAAMVVFPEEVWTPNADGDSIVTVTLIDMGRMETQSSEFVDLLIDGFESGLGADGSFEELHFELLVFLVSAASLLLHYTRRRRLLHSLLKVSNPLDLDVEGAALADRPFIDGEEARDDFDHRITIRALDDDITPSRNILGINFDE
jgi:hypothetical protein